MYFNCFPLVFLTPILADHLSINVDFSVKYHDIFIKAGDSLNLSCVGDTPLQWTYPLYNTSLDVMQLTSTSEKNEKIGDKYRLKFSLQDARYLDTGFYVCHPYGIQSSEYEPLHENPLARAFYVYVEDDNHLLVVNESFIILTGKQYRNLIIPCRPTSPDVNVTLKLNNEELVPGTDHYGSLIEYSPRIGFTLLEISDYASGAYTCKGSRGEKQSDEIVYDVMVLSHTDYVNQPVINTSPARHVLVGENVELDCSVEVSRGVIVTLDWIVPHSEDLNNGHIQIKDPVEFINGPQNTFLKEHKLLKINNVTMRDQGTYICNVTDHYHNSEHSSFNLVVLDLINNYLNLTESGSVGERIIPPGVKKYTLSVNIASYPDYIHVQWYRRDHNGKEIMIVSGDGKYVVTNSITRSQLLINNLDVYDSGVYRIYVTNGIETLDRSLNISVIVMGVPKLRMPSTGFYNINELHNVTCNIAAYEPTITWFYTHCENYTHCSDVEHQFTGQVFNVPNGMGKNVYLDSIAQINATNDMILRCQTCTPYFSSCQSQTMKISLVSDYVVSNNTSGLMFN